MTRLSKREKARLKSNHQRGYFWRNTMVSSGGMATRPVARPTKNRPPLSPAAPRAGRGGGRGRQERDGVHGSEERRETTELSVGVVDRELDCVGGGHGLHGCAPSVLAMENGGTTER